MKKCTIQLCTMLFISSLFISFPSQADSERGLASYYADSLNGNKTASGEPYNKNDLTAAHRTLEFGTSVKVTYLKTGKIVEVRINDRGPHVKDRIIDYIWVRGPIKVTESSVCFNIPDANDETLWPSDHAGVWADMSWA